MAVYGRSPLTEPAHTVGLAPIVIVGIGLIITLMAFGVLVQPVRLFVTVNIPVYVAGAAAPGTTNVIGEAGSAALVTFTNPAARAAPLKVMLY